MTEREAAKILNKAYDDYWNGNLSQRRVIHLIDQLSSWMSPTQFNKATDFLYHAEHSPDGS